MSKALAVVGLSCLIALACCRGKAAGGVETNGAVGGESGIQGSAPSGQEGAPGVPARSEPIPVPSLPSKARDGGRPAAPGAASADLRIPGGEAARFPEDFAIGPLGPGAAPLEAYEAGSRALAALSSQLGEPLGWMPGTEKETLEGLGERLRSIGAPVARLGGGRMESGGGASFLVRFVGREESISGILYLVEHEGGWAAEELRLDEAKQDVLEGGAYRYDPLAYPRFF